MEPICQAHGVDYVDLQLGREPAGMLLRLLIDKEGSENTEVAGSGVSIDDCVSVSRDVSAALDTIELPWAKFRLEVSSPGIERPLIKERDYERFAGKEVRVQTHEPMDGRKKFTGFLKGISEQVVELSLEGEKLVYIPLENIRKANLVVRF